MAPRLLALSLATCTLASTLTAQVTFNGRGTTANADDDAVATGAMTLSDDGTDLTIEVLVTTGFNFVANNIVMYVDSEAGGFPDNSAFTDNFDDPRIAASGFSGGEQRAPITFPAGFEANHAIVMQNGLTTAFELQAGGLHVALGSFDQVKQPGDMNDGTVTTVLPLAAIGNPDEIVFVTTYQFADGSRTDESYTEDIPGGANPGFDPVVYTQTATYATANATTILPVSLRHFSAEATATGVALAWETATEHNNAGFAVERSRDGVTWSELAFVDGHGTTDGAIAYAFADAAAPAGTLYYRLRQVDFDGQTAFSPVASVSLSDHRDTHVALLGSHPVHGVAVLRNETVAERDIRLFDITGRTVADFRLGGGETYRLDVSHLPAGTYVLQAGDRTRRLMVR